MTQAEQIKEALTMREVAETYGFTVTRAGYISCPLHSEKTPSLKLYPDDRGWYCYGCGVGGDVITFVEHVFHLDFRQAVARINYDFGLHLTTERPKKADIKRLQVKQQERKRREEREIQLFDNECRLTAEINRAEMEIREHPPARNGWETHYPREWEDAVRHLDRLRLELWENDIATDDFNREKFA